jgi:hypothetical protein
MGQLYGQASLARGGGSHQDDDGRIGDDGSHGGGCLESVFSECRPSLPQCRERSRSFVLKSKP